MTDTTSQHSSPDGFHIQLAEYLGDDAVSDPRVSKLLAELRQHRHSHPPIGATLTTSELEALPGGSIVVDPDGDAMQKGEPGIGGGGDWHGAGFHHVTFNERDLRGSALLWIPEAKEHSA